LAEAPLADGVVVQGDVVDIEALAEAMRRVWSEAGFPTRDVVLGLAGRDAVTRPLEIPDLSDRDLRSALAFELADMIPFPPSEAVLDVTRIDTEVDEHDVTMARVLAIAVHRQSIDPLVAAASSAKLRPVAADLVSYALVRAASIAGPTLAGTRALVHVGDASLTVVVHQDGVVRFTRRVAVAEQHISDAADLEADLHFVERYRHRNDASAQSSFTAVQTDPLVAAIAGTIEYYSIQAGAVPLSGVDLIGDPARAAVLVPSIETVLGNSIDARAVDEFADLHADELARSARGPYCAAIGLALEPGPDITGPAPLNLLPPPPAVPLRAVAWRAVGVAAATLVVGALFTTVAGPDDVAAADEADSAEAGVTALQARLSSMSSERADAVELKQATRRVERLAKDRVPWEILLGRVRASTPPDATLLSVTARAAQQSLTGPIPGAIELTGQGPTSASASTWLDRLAEVEGVRRPWLSSSATADRDGVAGVSTFTITVELDKDFADVLASTPGAGPVASAERAAPTGAETTTEEQP